MKFQLLDIIAHQPNPVTGRQVSAAERLAQTLFLARRAEERGFDAFAVGERHAGPFLSSSPVAILGAIAASTSRIRLQTGVTVLSLLDAFRVAEDYATIDQLSRGRLEITIGKGNELAHFPLFGLQAAEQYELLTEKYELLRELWSREEVDWSGRYRPSLLGATSQPRPYAGPIRIWHGSATSRTAVELAARWGDPLFSANAIQPLEAYQELIAHYFEEYELHGHDPAGAYVGAGSGAGGLFLADSAREAKRQFGPVYEGLVTARNVPGNNTPFRSIDHAIAEGPALVGTAEQVAEKILRFHDAFSHDLQSISLPSTVPLEQQLDILEGFATEVIPAVRAKVTTTLWEEGDPYAGRPAFAGGKAGVPLLLSGV
ncbi:alkanesulfonate monooxygenase SsuD/methylene tetrahydromethanopterin reductase-like flavin-dependent oxidoreductase (luciferase family) [Psychromicrobium silvestre]|uniref:Alkanesulfonate monooxygenase SsuD/methylene tetrahydromethanopterin reductase-like flavin-dependent oxidoreductase (Luciferase family) n=1 Tax=Psychromicrobium silvestre TaxID=1645614 RepID=A0A7Y9LRB9_9MICC|nr:LLM class flavin-dependent oxidoreductase [Psychromicrobium silvestre]NYE94167.1 alkanesulfonate monooxygenase SsuD/methylene tetrahydromethanopterin reductase-like flavin-dependent oxidoreductase (luciferase family) [Psychromicrobium silvestre]